MKVLVDSSAGTIRGTFSEPLNFSISGHYIVDVPAAVNVEASSQSVSDLVSAKLGAFRTLHPLLVNSFSDEFLDAAKVDSSMSTRIVTGINKRTAILPGGVLFTIPMTPIVGVTKVFLHYAGFSVYRDVGVPPSPPASKVLYNYDSAVGGFVDSTSSIIASITDGAGTLSSTPPPDTEYAVGAPSPFRLSFTNTTSKVMHMSDWVLLYG